MHRRKKGNIQEFHCVLLFFTYSLHSPLKKHSSAAGGNKFSTVFFPSTSKNTSKKSLAFPTFLRVQRTTMNNGYHRNGDHDRRRRHESIGITYCPYHHHHHHQSEKGIEQIDARMQFNGKQWNCVCIPSIRVFVLFFANSS